MAEGRKHRELSKVVMSKYRLSTSVWWVKPRWVSITPFGSPVVPDV